MKKFLLTIALVLLCGVTMAKEEREGRLTAAELNAKTEKTAILIRTTSKAERDTYYNQMGQRAALAENSVVYWVPAGDGAFYITKGDGAKDYLQKSNLSTFGTADNAAKFHAVQPTETGTGVNLAKDGNIYSTWSEGGDYWVRFAFTDNSKWFNFNSLQYNTGTGVWTVQNVYEVVPVTYNFTLDGETKLTKIIYGCVGEDFPELPALPFGCSATKPEGKIDADNRTQNVEVTVSLPFEYADCYSNIKYWYYMGIRDDSQGPSYLKYDALKSYIPTPGTIDGKENFAWSFIGNPFDGFEVVNYAAGDAKILSAPVAPNGNKNAGQLARMVEKEGAAGNTSWTFLKSTHNNAKENSFYIQHPTATAYAFNRQSYNSENSLCYWNSRDTGSSIWVVEVAMNIERELQLLVETAESQLSQLQIGTKVGQYSSIYENYEAVYADIVEYANNIPADATDEQIQEKINVLNAIIASFKINLPTPGNYYRIGYKFNGIMNYAQGEASGVTNKANGILMTTDKGAASVFYYGNDRLLSYTAGKYVKEDGSARGLQEINTDGGAVSFEAGSAVGTIAVKSPAYMHANTADGKHFIDHCGGAGCAAHNLFIEEVETLPVSISAAGMATFFAPVAVEIAENVKAYTVTINGEWATLNEITNGVIPANTGVVLEGAAGTYDFAITTANAFEGENALLGTAAAAYIAEDAYVLGYINVAEEGEAEKMEVGFFTATKNQKDNTVWKNNSHKAYLPKAAGMNAVSYSFRFGEGTTGVEEVKGEPTVDASQNGEVKAIFDLTGRRVEAITAPGIYIVGGKKTLVK